MDSSQLVTVKEDILIQLDSRNATIYNNGTYNSNITFDFDENVRNPRDTLITTLSVLSFIAPNSPYIINETNNILALFINNATQIIYVPYGNYNATTLIETLNTLIPDFQITFNEKTDKFTFTHPNKEFDILGEFSTIHEILGFEKGVTVHSFGEVLNCLIHVILTVSTPLTSI